MNTKYNELEDRYEVDPQSIVGSELLNVETPNKYVTYAGLERAVKNVLSKAKDYDKGLVGGYNGSFPLTAATKGNIYLLPVTKKYYVCIENYNGSQLTAPNANFEELSVYTNRSKLDNLITLGKLNNNQRIIKIGSLKFIFGEYQNMSLSSATIDFIEQFNTVFNVMVTPYGNDPTTVRIEYQSITKNGFKVIWQEFTANDPIVWIAIGI